MANIFDYIKWRGDLSVEQCDFNEIDGLIMSAFSYLPFHVLDGALDGKRLGEIADSLLMVENIEKEVIYKGDITLLESFSDSPRFNQMKFYQHDDIYDSDSQTQFSAITVKLKEDLYGVFFRGTDTTLVGWKEDFNMTFVCPVPSQKMATKYMEKVSSTFNGEFIVCGHSKGGNLAIYSSVFSSANVRDRIIRVCNYDGPGFDVDILGSYAYKDIAERIDTYIPQSSVVGFLLGHEEEYRIVHSSQSIGILQHELYTWELMGNQFIYVDDVTSSSHFVDSTLKDWLKGISYEQRELFVDTVYTILSQTNAKTVKQMGSRWFSSARAILKTIKNLDEDTQAAVLEILSSLAKCAKSNMFMINPMQQILKKKKSQE
ncbi:MAG: DUF2974 domain-containing protein [Eubacteriales bacterium]|nr:DUF2974 domain-containing protein [Eubacteriales bacterium]